MCMNPEREPAATSSQSLLHCSLECAQCSGRSSSSLGGRLSSLNGFVGLSVAMSVSMLCLLGRKDADSEESSDDAE